MPEIQMPPAYAGGDYYDPKDTDGRVAEAVRNLARQRALAWMQLVLDAITEFERNAGKQIDHLEYDNDDADYSLNPVIAAFTEAVIKGVFSEADAVVTVVSETMDALREEYEKKAPTALAAAKQRLHDSVTALAQAASERATLAGPAIQEKVPEIVEDGMTWIESVSTDPDYVSSLCDYVGFPNPTRENTLRPVRQSLENPFFGVYQSVRAQLLKANGQGTDDWLNPARWEREAVLTQQQLYAEQGEPAWEKIYAGVLPDKSVI